MVFPNGYSQMALVREKEGGFVIDFPDENEFSTLNFFNPPDTKLRKLKVELVISARGLNKNFNG